MLDGRTLLRHKLHAKSDMSHTRANSPTATERFERYGNESSYRGNHDEEGQEMAFHFIRRCHRPWLESAAFAQEQRLISGIVQTRVALIPGVTVTLTNAGPAC
jgi:hypothetical protein